MENNNREFMKELLLKMFTGWIIREKSWIPNPEYDPETSDAYVPAGKYGKTREQAMIEACGGDEKVGYLLHLFDHWGRDIMNIAPHFGLAYVRKDSEGNLLTEAQRIKSGNVGEPSIMEDVPPAPSPDHWWYDNEWQEPISDDSLILNHI